MKKIIITIMPNGQHVVKFKETEGDVLIPRDMRNIARAVRVESKKHFSLNRRIKIVERHKTEKAAQEKEETLNASG